MPVPTLLLALTSTAQTPNGVRAMEAIDPQLRERLAAHNTKHMVQQRFSATGDLISSTDKGDQAARVLEYGDIYYLQWSVLQVGAGGRGFTSDGAALALPGTGGGAGKSGGPCELLQSFAVRCSVHAKADWPTGWRERECALPNS